MALSAITYPLRALTFALLSLALPASAQPLDVPKSFELFDRFCRPALTGLETLKPILPVPGPFGEKVYAVSPDGNLITVQTGLDDYLVLAEFRYGPGFVMRNCMVQQLIAPTSDLATLEAAFQAQVWRGDGIVMTGGEVVEEIPAIGMMAMTGRGNVTRSRNSYVIVGATEPAGSVVQVMIAQGVFTLTGFVAVPR